MGTKTPSLAENWTKKIKTLRQKKKVQRPNNKISFATHFITNFGANFFFFHSQFLILLLILIYSTFTIV
jgi:hypothetical protein